MTWAPWWSFTTTTPSGTTSELQKGGGSDGTGRLAVIGGGARASGTRRLALCLTAATGLGTCAQFVLGALAPFLVADLGLSRGELGSLSTTMFAAAIVATPVVGVLVDRAGGRTMILVMLSLSAAGLVVLASGRRYPEVLVGVVLAGTGTAVANPTTNQLIAHYIPRASQGVVTGLKQSGVHIGAVAVGLFLPWLASDVGWRVAVAVTAAVSVGGVVASAAVIPVATRSPNLEDLQDAAPADASWHSAAVWWLSLYAIFMGAGVASVTAYLALYGFEVLRLTEAGAGALVAVLGATAVGSRILWGRVVDGYRWGPPAMAIMAASGVASIAALVGAGRGTAWLAWPAVVGLGAGAASWTVVAALILVRRAQIDGMGKASAVVQAAFYGGFVLTPGVFGTVVDRAGSYEPAWLGVAALFAAGTGCAILWSLRERQQLWNSSSRCSEDAAPGSSSSLELQGPVERVEEDLAT